MEAGAISVECHPFEPFLPEGARVLLLGSFPPQARRWSMEFYYPNFINDFWRICGLYFFGDREHFVVPGRKRFDKEAIVTFCREKGLAMYDTASAVRRLADNASDKFLEVVEATDVAALLAKIPQCRTLVTTGQKATDVLVARFGCQEPAVGECVPLSLPVPVEESVPAPVGRKAAGAGMAWTGSGSIPSQEPMLSTAVPLREMTFWRMPSTSRAYPLSLEKKAEAYAKVFASIGF